MVRGLVRAAISNCHARDEAHMTEVVTGATDGIGKEFALQLAKKGFNILLVSRSEDKLKAVTNEIGELYRPNKS